MAENTNLINYYKDLLILQYKRKSKAIDHIKSLIETEMVFDLIDDIENGFSIDTGVGVQLDIIGKYLEVDRVIRGVPFTQDYFGFMLYGTTPGLCFWKGFMEYGDTPPDVNFLKYGESEDVLTLNDTEYRNLLKFRAIQANSLFSLLEVDQSFWDYFGSSLRVIDNEDMTITFEFPLSESKLATILQSEDLLPRPIGVEAIITFV